MCFSLKFYYKDVGKNPNKNIENCLSYAACRFQKTCFEICNIYEKVKNCNVKIFLLLICNSSTVKTSFCVHIYGVFHGKSAGFRTLCFRFTRNFKD